MKTKGLVKLLVGLTLAASGAFAVRNGLSHKKAEVVEAGNYSGSIIIQKNSDNGGWTSRGKLVGYLYNGSSNTWGTAVTNNSSTYQEYSWSGLDFEPTTIIILNVADNWSSSWDNPWWSPSCRTGNVTLSGSNVVWMQKDASESENWGSYSMETFVMNSSDTKIGELGNYKVASGGSSIEAFGEISLSANQQFYIKKTIDGSNKYNTYTCLDLISSNLSNVGNYIKVTQAATYEFYFNFNGNTLYLTDPVIAAADEWAQDFLANVGCDPTGKTAPSGWAGEITRFNSITDSRVKDKIYSAVANKTGSYLEQAVYWYDYAVAAHPELTKFIKNSSNVVRASNNLVSANPLFISNQNTNTIAIIVIISLVSVTAIGGYFFIRKRKSI